MLVGIIARTSSPSRVNIASVSYLALRLTGFATVTLLMTWGLLVLFFVAIGGFTVDGTINQIANFSTRYVAADPTRIATFKVVLAGVHVVLAASIIFFRRHAILARRRHSQEPGA